MMPMLNIVSGLTTLCYLCTYLKYLLGIILNIVRIPFYLKKIHTSRIVTQGFHKKVGPNKSTPRIPVSPNFLLEMIEGAYFAMFNEFYTLALQAVKDIDKRAQYELFPDVMLVTSAVINSLKNNSSGKKCYSINIVMWHSRTKGSMEVFTLMKLLMDAKLHEIIFKCVTNMTIGIADIYIFQALNVCKSIPYKRLSKFKLLHYFLHSSHAEVEVA